MQYDDVEDLPEIPRDEFAYIYEQVENTARKRGIEPPSSLRYIPYQAVYRGDREAGSKKHNASYHFISDIIYVSEAFLRENKKETVQLGFAHEQGHDWDKEQRPSTYNQRLLSLFMSLESRGQFVSSIYLAIGLLHICLGRSDIAATYLVAAGIFMLPGTIDREIIRHEHRANRFAYEETGNAQALADFFYENSFVSKVKPAPLRALASGMELLLYCFSNHSAPSWEAGYWRRQAERDARGEQAQNTKG